MVNDELLTLYYYRDELSDKQLAAIELALEQDQSLARHYAQLCSQLDGLKAKNNARATPQAMQRWHTALNQAAAQEITTSAHAEKPARSFWLERLFRFNVPAAAAAVLVLALGVVIGVNLQTSSTAGFPDSAIADHSGQSFVRGVSAYMQEAEMQLAGLEAGDVSQRRVLITEIISRNRLYIRAAENSQSPELARVLRAFEPVLISLADPQTASQQFDMAKAQLSFELSAMQTKLTHDASKQTTRL